MNKLEMAKRAFITGSRFVRKHLPTIMSIGAGIGACAAVGLAIKEAPAAMEKVEQRVEKDPDITAVEKGAAAIQELAPAIIVLMLTLVLIFGANHINIKRIAGIATLYSAVSADNKIKEKALETAEDILGKDKVNEIKAKVLKEDKEEVAVSDHSEPLYGRGERRPCRLIYKNKPIGGIFYNSYNGIDIAMTDIAEEASTYGAAPMRKMLTMLKMADDYYIGDLLVVGPDFDYTIYSATVGNAAGWDVCINNDLMIDYDSELDKCDIAV